MKTIPLIGLGILSCIRLSAQVEGPLNPTSCYNSPIPGYNQSWTEMSNIAVSDNNYASFGNLTGGTGSYTDYLVATNFRFQIPPETIIYGIKVEVECADPSSRTSDYSVRIVKIGNVSGIEKAAGTPYPVADGYMVYGGASDLWGETWDYKFIDDNDFGVAIAAQRNAADSMTAGRVDNIRITVYYNFTTLPVTLTTFTAIKESKTIQIKWSTVSESSMEHYEVENSSDGTAFYSLTSIPAVNVPAASYRYIDNNPLSGISYYRLKMEGLAGYQKYSPVVAVSFREDNCIALHPSPWQPGTELNITNDNNEKLIIYFLNAGGQVMSTAITQSKLIPVVSLVNRKGLVYYKIHDFKKNLLGSGTLLIL